MTRNVPDANNAVGTLSQRTLIRIEGSDAPKLLQGQLSNDVAALAVGQQQFTSLNSPKGRLLATGYLMHAAPQAYWLEVPKSLAEAVARRLKLFVLRSDVRIDALEAATALAVIGTAPAALHDSLAPLLDDNAAMENGAVLADGRLAMPRPGRPRRAVIWSTTHDTQSAHHHDLSDAWRLADILAGIPNLVPETQDRFIAQHAGLGRLNGISFTKGCFTGQEVIARLHYLGQAKRFLVQGTSATAPAAGHRLMTTAGDRAVGEVIDAVMCSGQSHWLAVLQGDAFTSSDLQLSSDQPVSSLRYFDEPVINEP